MKHVDITNQTFGSLTAIKLDHVATTQHGDKREFWQAKCVCGKTLIRRKDSITNCKAAPCRCRRANGAIATNNLLKGMTEDATRAATLEHKQSAATLQQEQRANRAGVPASMRQLAGRLIPARHNKGRSFGGGCLPTGHSSAFATMEGAP